MTINRTVVQFVCFKTPLPRPAFVPGWAPFAGALLTQGMRHSILAERLALPSAESGFYFIARNEWPEEAFTRAPAGRPGDSDDGLSRAAQGGAFWATGPVPSRAEFINDKVIALLSIPDGDTTKLQRTIVDTLPGTRLFLYGDAVTECQRFNLVAEVYCALGQGAGIASQLQTAVAGLVDPIGSTIAVYLEILTLPPPAPAL
jgi:hypothetical protein